MRYCERERENRCCHWIDISAGCTLNEAATTTAGIFLGYVGNIFFMIYVSFDWLGRSKSEWQKTWNKG